MGIEMSSKSRITRYDAACAMAILAANQCEDIELVVTAGNDGARKHASKRIEYPSKGFNLINQILMLKKHGISLINVLINLKNAVIMLRFQHILFILIN